MPLHVEIEKNYAKQNVFKLELKGNYEFGVIHRRQQVIAKSH